MMGCKIEPDDPLPQKEITITDIPSAYSGRYGISAFGHQYNGNILAMSDTAVINDSTVTMELYDYRAGQYSMAFTESGNYIVIFVITNYLGTTVYWSGGIGPAHITQKTTSIPFNDLIDVPLASVPSSSLKLKCTVVFNSNGGSSIPAISGVSYREKIARPTDPVKNGSIFAGWYKDAGLVYEWDFHNDTVVEDMTLYAKWYKESEVVKIIIKDKKNEPVSGINITGVAANKTTKSGVSNKDGVVFLNYQDGVEVTILIASPLFEGLVKSINTSQNYTFNFNDDTKGSVIAPSGTCYIPGLSGRLNPIKDTSNRLYLYADNIAINGGLQQPVHFNLTNSLELEDANGIVKNIWIPFIDGRTALINYSPK
jgi:uncharacterized repeat protein (TIGR02543 family)